MDVDEFWAIVESAAAETGASAGDDGEAIAEAMVTRLAEAGPEAMLGFEEQFERFSDALYRWDVWAAAYLIGGGCSDDSFMDFRAGVITLGRQWVERVLANPDTLAEHPLVLRAVAEGNDAALLAEMVNYVASTAYERLVGDDEAFYEAYERWRAGSDAEDTDEAEDGEGGAEDAEGGDGTCAGTCADCDCGAEMDDAEMGERFNFDDEDEMRRRLPKLAALYLGAGVD